MPLYELMSGFNLPIFLHPRRPNTTPDYEGETDSKFLVFTNFGWPYETSKAMARLAFGGVLENYPNLKVITHHAGGMVPYFSKRIQLSWDFNQMRMGYRPVHPLKKEPLEYYKIFYCDTAIQGNTAALMCAHDFFGVGHMLFGTDTPYDNQLGERVYLETIEAIQKMPIADAEKKMIFEGNIRKLLRLPI
jgi:aminocarboxymuconate-semialdehyde decarboxylase